MRHLWVLRHAKAEAGAPGGDDHERALTDRGRRQGVALAELVPSMAGPTRRLPGLVLCSTALRARQTAAPVVAVLGAGVSVEEEAGLYQADAEDVVERLRLVDDDEDAVMVVGHNPTLHEVCFELAADDDAGVARLREGFPTAALAVIELDVASWTALARGSGRLAELVVVSGR